MSAWRSRAEFDPQRFGVKIAIGRAIDESLSEVITWPNSLTIRRTDAAVELGADDHLRIDEEIARALYEALADYFGGAGHDTRALRKDYDAERARVDKFIAHLTEGDRP